MRFFNGNRRKSVRFKDTLKPPGFLFNFENKLKLILWILLAVMTAQVPIIIPYTLT